MTNVCGKGRNDETKLSVYGHTYKTKHRLFRDVAAQEHQYPLAAHAGHIGLIDISPNIYADASQLLSKAPPSKNVSIVQ